MDDFARAGADPYAGYASWKGWDGAFAASDRKRRYFAAEFRDVPLGGKRVLEIGFGNGEFLAFAKGEGAGVAGLEIRADARDAARRHGFEALDDSLPDIAASGRRFDVVVALDVLEHWDFNELVAGFRAIHALLADGGRFVSRFPNGQSPFGRIYQNGDFSHKTALSTYKIEYLARLAGFGIVRIDNARRVPSRPGPIGTAWHWWLAQRRRRLERRIARLYGIRRLPLDPNLVAVLEKRGVEELSQRKTA
jgi:SAM-dependent methyltransferase